MLQDHETGSSRPRAEQPETQHAPKRAPLWRWLASKHPIRRGTLLVVLALVVEYLVLPQIAGGGRSLHLLGLPPSAISRTPTACSLPTASPMCWQPYR